MRRVDPHLNLFHAYRGSAGSEVAKEAQLEDNLTRALAVTLNNLQNQQAGDGLLAELGWQQGWGKFERCELQVSRADRDWPAREHRRLLVLHGGPTLQVTGPADSGAGGRVDAVIIGEHGMLAIESKLGNRVAASQLAAHQATLDIREPPGDVRWPDVAKRIRSMLEDVSYQSADALLLRELYEYLQMSGFGGLSHDHFAYFAMDPATREEAEETKDGVRRFLAGLMEEVRVHLDSPWDVDQGHIRKTDMATYAALKPPQPDAGQPPHLSCAIDAARLSIFANVETRPAFKAFTQAWGRDPDGLLRFLHGLGDRNRQSGAPEPQWRFHVLYRFQTAPRQYRNESRLDLAAAFVHEIGSQAPEVIERALGSGHAGVSPQIKIVRQYHAAELLGDESVADRFIADATELVPFFDWIDTPIGTR